MADAEGKFAKESYFPITIPTNAYSLDVVTKKLGWGSGGASQNHHTSSSRTTSMNSQFPSSSGAAQLQVGDRVAIKPSNIHEISSIRSAFSSTNEIDSILIVASDSGIIPVYSLLKSLLSDSLTSVKRVEVIWLNLQQQNFILQNEIEELERDYPLILSVTRVVDGDLLESRAKLSSQIPITSMPFRLGRMAMVFAPALVRAKIASLLHSAGYSNDSIVAIKIGS
jgi:ferredoxin-NADP reductase